MKPASRSSRATGPKIRVPLGLLSAMTNGGVLIKTDVGTVVTAQAVLATDDDGLDHVALLHGTTGSSLLDAANHDVTDVCVSLAGTAQYTEAH